MARYSKKSRLVSRILRYTAFLSGISALFGFLALLSRTQYGEPVGEEVLFDTIELYIIMYGSIIIALVLLLTTYVVSVIDQNAEELAAILDENRK